MVKQEWVDGSKFCGREGKSKKAQWRLQICSCAVEWKMAEHETDWRACTRRHRRQACVSATFMLTSVYPSGKRATNLPFSNKFKPVRHTVGNGSQVGGCPAMIRVVGGMANTDGVRRRLTFQSGRMPIFWVGQNADLWVGQNADLWVRQNADLWVRQNADLLRKRMSCECWRLKLLVRTVNMPQVLRVHCQVGQSIGKKRDIEWDLCVKFHVYRQVELGGEKGK